MVVPYRLIRVSDQVLSLSALVAMSVGVPMRWPRSLGRPGFPLAAGVGWWNTALLRALVVRVTLRPRPAKCPAPYAASPTRWMVLLGKASATWSRRSRPRSGLLRPPLTHRANRMGNAIGRRQNGRVTTIASTTQLLP